MYANKIIEIKDDFITASSSNFIYYTHDTNNTLKASDILEHDNLTLAEHTYLGTIQGSFWTRLEVKNRSSNIQELAIYNPFANIGKLDVYIYKDTKLIRTILLGDLREQKTKKTLSRLQVFKLTLMIDETVTIVTKISNNIYSIGWDIKPYENFINNEFDEILVVGIFFGLILIYILFNMFSYFFYRDPVYLIMSIIICSFTLYIFGGNGILYKMNIGLNLQFIVAICWNAGTVAVLFTILYPYYFFNTKEKYPNLSYYLLCKAITILGIIIILVYAQFIDEKYFFITTILFLFIIVNSLSLLLISIYMYKKKESGSLYYLLGQGGLMICIIIYLLNMLGYIPYTEINKYMLPFGMIVDYIFFSIALYKRNKNKMIELENKKNTLLEQSRFNSIGQAIGDITHQWKTPLTYIGTSLTTLEATYHHKKENFDDAFLKQLPNIKTNINLMKNTIDEFTQYYSGNIKIQNFKIQNLFDNILKLLNSKIILHKVDIKIELNTLKTIYGYEHIFSNILLVLINNSLDQFDEIKSNNQITITLSKEKDKIKINYQDNAGGIKIEPIEKIFDYFVSTKESTKNSGMGLSIVKMLVEDRLKGRISVQNTKNGVAFELIL